MKDIKDINDVLDVLDEMKNFEKSKKSLNDQLKDLSLIALKFGLYDAYEVVKDLVKTNHEKKYGCFVEAYIENGKYKEVFPSCVFDTNNHYDCSDCLISKNIKSKEECAYWKEIPKNAEILEE